MYPVMRTIDSITIEITRPVWIELAKRVRPPASSKTNAIRVSTTTQKNACSSTRLGSGATGRRFSSTAPRIGSDLPRAYSTTMMTTNGKKLRTPVCIHSRLPVNHVHLLDVEQGLHSTERQTAGDGDRDRAQTTDQRGGERGHDQGGQPDRGDRSGDRADDDDREGREYRGDHPVDGGERLRREAEEHGTLFVAGGRSSREAEAQEAVRGPQHEAHQHREPDDVQVAARDTACRDRGSSRSSPRGRCSPAAGTSCRS